MSYITSVNGVQIFIFSNNEYYIELENFIKSHGIEIDDDCCYDGEIDDVVGMLDAIDKITRRLIKERKCQIYNGETDYDGKPLLELTDLSNSMWLDWLDDDTPILMFDAQMLNYAYCFLPYQVYLAVKDVIEPTHEVYKKDGVNWDFCTYKLKDGAKIRVHAG